MFQGLQKTLVELIMHLKRRFQQESSSGTVVTIQLARGIAAMMVVADHFIIRLVEMGVLSTDTLPIAYSMGGVGVEVFFAISGYVMILSNWRKFDQGRAPQEFLLRRLARIWPMYFLATLLVVVGGAQGPSAHGATEVMKSLLFIPFQDAGGQYRPVLGKGWTLNYEMYFYAVLALALFFSRTKGVVFAGVVLLGVVIVRHLSQHQLFDFYGDLIVGYFLVGACVALLFGDRDIKPPTQLESVFLSVVAAACLLMGVLFEASKLSAAAKHIVGAVLVFIFMCALVWARNPFRSRLIAGVALAFGGASYSLYLFHGFVFVAVFRLIGSGNSCWVNVGASILSAVMATCVAWLAYQLMERPIQQRIEHWMRDVGWLGAKSDPRP